MFLGMHTYTEMLLSPLRLPFRHAGNGAEHRRGLCLLATKVGKNAARTRGKIA